MVEPHVQSSEDGRVHHTYDVLNALSAQGTTEWWFGNAVADGVKSDAIGLSCYGYWHGPLSNGRESRPCSATTTGRSPP